MTGFWIGSHPEMFILGKIKIGILYNNETWLSMHLKMCKSLKSPDNN